MSGTDIIGSLLQGPGGVTGVVPEEQIRAGILPDGTPLPALVVIEISSVERAPLRRGATVRTTDRVRVTVRASNHRQRRDIIDQVKDLCAGRVGTIGGMPNVAIRHAGKGPDLNGPASSFEKSIDFRVSYDATT